MIAAFTRHVPRVGPRDRVPWETARRCGVAVRFTGTRTAGSTIRYGLETMMSNADTSPDGALGRLVDEQLELAAARLPALAPGIVHPSPADHEELKSEHPRLEEVLLGTAAAPAGMVDELAALEAAPPVAEDELARQALADGGADGDPTTPE
jgi:hypothetical protein